MEDSQSGRLKALDDHVNKFYIHQKESFKYLQILSFVVKGLELYPNGFSIWGI